VLLFLQRQGNNYYIWGHFAMKICKICREITETISNGNLQLLVPDSYPLSGDITLEVCLSCQFVFNESSSTENDYKNYYVNFNKHHVRYGKHKELDRVYFEQICGIISENFIGGLIGCDVLDFGSGSLLFGEIAKSFGATTVTNYDIGGTRPSNIYDTAVATHVFEHILDPLTALRNLTLLVKEDGLVLIAVPDLERYGELYYGPYSNFDLEHINHFSMYSLSKMFELSGLEIILVEQGERRVAPNLSYSEVLILGKKIARPAIAARKYEFSALDCMSDLIAKSDKDMELLLEGFVNVVARVKGLKSEGKDKALVLYGLSSYAFRFLNMLKNKDLLEDIDFFADSDERLKGLQFPGGNNRIVDKELFSILRSEYEEKKQEMVAIVVAINSDNIVGMFQNDFPDLDIEVLPPLTLNR